MQFFVLRIDVVQTIEGGGGFLGLAGIICERGKLFHHWDCARPLIVFFQLLARVVLIALGQIRIGEQLVDVARFT